MTPRIDQWLGKNVRVTVTQGPKRGQHGRAIRPDGRGTWMVHMDGRFGGDSIPAHWLSPES